MTETVAIHGKQKVERPTPINPVMPANFAALLKQKFPAQMKEFNAAPWDYKIFGPLGMDDMPMITIYLYIGKKAKEKEYTLELPIS